MKKTIGILSLGALSTALFAAAPPTVIPAMNAPVLDGVLEENEWNSAFQQKLVRINNTSKITQDTLCYIGCDQKNLYVAFRCNENAIDKMRRVHTHMEERDSAIYQDDCAEILIDISGSDQPSIFHFAVNSCGLVYDDWNGDTGYQSDIKVASKLEKDYWVMEAQIPFADLGFTPHGAELMRMNLGRERHFGGEYSCSVEGEGSFLALSHFITFRPMPPGAAETPVSISGFGTPADPKVHFLNTSDKEAKTFRVKVETLDSMRQTLRAYNAVTKPGAAETLVEYIANGQTPAAAVRLTVYEGAEEGKALYNTTYAFPMDAAKKQLRVMKIENPLLEPLFSDEKPEPRDFHGYQWVFGAAMEGYMNMFAVQNALPYSVRDIAVEHKNTGMAMFSNAKMVPWMKEEIFALEYDIPMAAMPRVLDKEINTDLPYGLYILPEQRKAYLNDVKNLASDKSIRIITFCDELSECIEIQIIEEFAKHPDDKDLKAFDAKIKAKYGQGKYGIPSSIEESNPFALIAYRHALNDELVSLYRDASGLARSINPDVLLVSDDPVGAQARLYSFADQRGLFDIATHQLYPRCNPNQDEFGFITHYVADLTQAEVWPCPHIEEYAASFTPEEVLYELSGAVRGGATGFVYYLDDSTGKETGKRYLIHERWGAPDRYAVELNVQKFLKTMPRLKFPERDTALFSSTDSLRGQSGMMFRRQVDNDVFLHGFLGYGAGVGYRFINELTLQNLEQYKFIATTESQYLPKEAFNALKSYVSKGGTLLVVNPVCFSYTSDGEKLDEARKKFTGVTVNGNSENAQYFEYAGNKVEVSSLACVKFVPEASTKVLARFANGDPAVVEKKLGKGRVVSLAANPCVARLAGNKSWKTFFHAFAKQCNAKVDCDIWRFELPKSLLPETVELPGTCITNNAVRMEHYIPVRINGSELTGSYSFSPEPDHTADCVKGEISFAEGKLTDRPRALMGGSCVLNKSIWTDWAVCWTQGKAITINAKWSAPAPVTQVKFMLSGVWSDAKLEIGGKSYDFPLPDKFNERPLSVREFTMTLPQAVKASSLKVHLAPSTGNITIAEMEIWSE